MIKRYVEACQVELKIAEPVLLLETSLILRQKAVEVMEKDLTEDGALGMTGAAGFLTTSLPCVISS